MPYSVAPIGHRSRKLAALGAFTVLMFAAMLSTGCSPFESDWDAAAVTPPPTNDITGRWIGTWQNENNEHTGPMRAIVTRVDETHVKAYYWAKWSGIFKFESQVLLTTERRGDRFHFSGESDLDYPVAGGIYEYEGYATPSEFFSTYDSESNDGTYTMKRPGVGE